MPDETEDLTLVFSCNKAGRVRGGEEVRLDPTPGENQGFFAGTPNGVIQFTFNQPRGYGWFDPDLDYDVIFRPRRKS